MKLKSFLRLTGRTAGQASKELGVRPETISSWIKGHSVPSLRMAIRIRTWSKGAITELDWVLLVLILVGCSTGTMPTAPQECRTDAQLVSIGEYCVYSDGECQTVRANNGYCPTWTGP